MPPSTIYYTIINSPNNCTIGIDSITAGLANGLERCKTVEDIFAELDRFARDLVDKNIKLRNLQRPYRPADAGK
jgi:hypothetical protein